MEVRGELHMHPVFFLGRFPQIVNGQSLNTPEEIVWIWWKTKDPC